MILYSPDFLLVRDGFYHLVCACSLKRAFPDNPQNLLNLNPKKHKTMCSKEAVNYEIPATRSHTRLAGECFTA